MSDTSPPLPASPAGSETIWTRPTRGARGPQPEHNRAEIAAAAISLADVGGLSAVSMRAVAGALGSTAGSLYRYLSSRDDLLDLMVDAVLAELRLDQAAGDWLNDLVALADQQLDLYRRHPWLSEASLRGAPFGPNGTNYFEECLRIMDPLDCTTASKLEAIAMITGMVYLFARAATPTSVTNPFAAATPEAHPYLTAALADPTPGTPSDDLFGRTIRSILGGLLAAEGGQEERNAQ